MAAATESTVVLRTPTCEKVTLAIAALKLLTATLDEEAAKELPGRSVTADSGLTLERLVEVGELVIDPVALEDEVPAETMQTQAAEI